MYTTLQQRAYTASDVEISNDEGLIADYENPTDKFVEELSKKISTSMLPIYDQFKEQTENGKVFGFYPILRFSLPEQPGLRQNFFSSYPLEIPESSSFYGQQQLKDGKVSYKEIQNRMLQKQRIQHLSVSQRKIHQLLDQNQARQSNGEDLSDQRNYGFQQNQNSEFRKLQRARKYYEKLSRQMKSSKKFKRRFKDKNRPKKAKSAYNLFVEEVVPQIKAENPSFSAPDLVRVAARMYNQLTEEQKVPYQRRYLVDKERFEREREAYFQKNPQMDYRLDAKQKAAYMNGRFMGM